MMQTVEELLASKKFLASLFAMLAFALGHWGIHVDADKMAELVAPVMAYIVSQGIADHGKEAAKIQAAAAVPANDNKSSYAIAPDAPKAA